MCETCLTHCSVLSIVDFEQVNSGREATQNQLVIKITQCKFCANMFYFDNEKEQFFACVSVIQGTSTKCFGPA